MANSEIDFARAATLMDVVQKVTVVAPRCTGLLSAAMEELNAMNDIATKEAEARAEERSRQEQEAQAAKLAEHEEANETTGIPFISPKTVPAFEVDRRV